VGYDGEYIEGENVRGDPQAVMISKTHREAQF